MSGSLPCAVLVTNVLLLTITRISTVPLTGFLVKTTRLHYFLYVVALLSQLFTLHILGGADMWPPQRAATPWRNGSSRSSMWTSTPSTRMAARLSRCAGLSDATEHVSITLQHSMRTSIIWLSAQQAAPWRRLLQVP